MFLLFLFFILASLFFCNLISNSLLICGYLLIFPFSFFFFFYFFYCLFRGFHYLQWIHLLCFCFSFNDADALLSIYFFHVYCYCLYCCCSPLFPEKHLSVIVVVVVVEEVSLLVNSIRFVSFIWIVAFCLNRNPPICCQPPLTFCSPPYHVPPFPFSYFSHSNSQLFNLAIERTAIIPFICLLVDLAVVCLLLLLDPLSFFEYLSICRFVSPLPRNKEHSYNVSFGCLDAILFVVRLFVVCRLLTRLHTRLWCFSFVYSFRFYFVSILLSLCCYSFRSYIISL